MGTILNLLIFSACLLTVNAEFIITEDEQEITLDEGEESLDLQIPDKEYGVLRCLSGRCRSMDSNSKEPLIYSCQWKEKEKILHVTFNGLNLSISHEKTWQCEFGLENAQKEIVRLERNIKVRVRKNMNNNGNGGNTERHDNNGNNVEHENNGNNERHEKNENKWGTNDKNNNNGKDDKADSGAKFNKANWYYIGGAIVVLVLLIIIGQTMCIVYFKAKARKAQINRNLTPRTSSADELAGRYESRPSKKNTPEHARDSTIYESLEDALKGQPPVPPPISTLPRTPKPKHLIKSTSQTTLVVDRDGRMNKDSLDRCASLERIKRRPPLPLPTEGIYEVVPAHLGLHHGDSDPSLSNNRTNQAVQHSHPMDDSSFKRTDPRGIKLPPLEHHRSNPTFHAKPTPLSLPTNQWQKDKMPTPPTIQWKPHKMPALIDELRTKEKPINQWQSKEKIPTPTNQWHNQETNKKTQPNWQLNKRMPANDWQPNQTPPKNWRPNQAQWAPASPITKQWPANQREDSPNRTPVKATPPAIRKLPVAVVGPGSCGRLFEPGPPRMAMPVLPSMISIANLRPVRPMTQSSPESKITPAPSFSQRLRPPVLPSKPKPPMPSCQLLPTNHQPQPASYQPPPTSHQLPPKRAFHQEPEHATSEWKREAPSPTPDMPESYYGSDDDDDEWTYEPLPKYNQNIYNL